MYAARFTAQERLDLAVVAKMRGYSDAFIRRAIEAATKREMEKAHQVEIAKAKTIFTQRGTPKSVVEIIVSVADKHGVSPADVASDALRKAVTDARHEAIYRIKEAGPMRTCPMIGRWFGKDHTTILFALSKFAHVNGLPQLTGYNFEGCAQRNRERARKASMARKAIR